MLVNFLYTQSKKVHFTRTRLQRRCQWEHDGHIPKSCLDQADSWLDQKTKRLQLERKIKFRQDCGVVFCAVATLLKTF